MDKANYFNRKSFVFFIVISILLFVFLERTHKIYRSIIQPHRSNGITWICPSRITDQTITPLNNTKHFLVSAYMDQRVKGFDIRIISIFRRDSIQPLNCLFCCAGYLSTTTPATILVHSDHFGFSFGTTDVGCQIPQNCNPTHVTLVAEQDNVKTLNPIWLPIRNKETHGKDKKAVQFNFTVCISTLFGEYNNVLQYAQTLEMYRLLGVGRVVIYNNSCGPELNRLLQNYSQEGFVEMVPWPVHNYLNPSHGWLFSKHGGDLQYYGQLVALNDCIYRSMDRSRYVLLNDIDEIVMPYQHDNLMSMMDMLEHQYPNTGVFIIQVRAFPMKSSEESKKGSVGPWGNVPGINILERIYWEDHAKNVYHAHKMIIQPRLVEQTSVHDVLKMFGQKFKVPLKVCQIIHCRIRDQRPELTLEQLHLDTRLWDFKDKLIPRVNEMLRRANLLSSEGER